MPQLNPTPWMLVMITTWLIINFILALINNINLITYPPTPMKTNSQINHWTWPW